MSMSEVIQDITKWLAWGGSGLGVLTILGFSNLGELTNYKESIQEKPAYVYE